MSVTAIAERAEAPSVIEQNNISTNALMLNADIMNQALAMADAMSKATITVPNHLRGKPGDCLAIVMQAMQWGMNPFSVAQKTHVVNGTLGYEAQLVNAVVQQSGAITGRFHYEYTGEGDTLQCRVGAVPRGETEVTWGEWLASREVTTKNSPLWKTNPRQQIGYLQVKNWARAFAPGAILGVYSVDELADHAPVMRDMGAADVVRDDPPATSKTERVRNKIARNRKPEGPTLAAVMDDIAMAETLDALKLIAETAAKLEGDDQQQAREAWAARKAEITAEHRPAATYAEVADAMNKAGDIDTLNLAADRIRDVADDSQREELANLYAERRAVIEPDA